MEACGQASRLYRALYRQTAIRVLIPRVLFFCVALAAIPGAALPDAWATPAATTTTLTVTSSGSAVTSVTSGTVVTLTATVLSGSTPVSPGQVTFCDASAAHCEDAALLVTAQLTTAGVATYKFRPGPGSHGYQAVFVGTNNFARSSSSAVSVSVIGPFSTATFVTSSGVAGNYSVTATVTGSGNSTLSPTGNISLLDATNAGAQLGTATLEESRVTENFTTTYAFTTTYNVYAVVVGDFNGDGIPDLITNGNAKPGYISEFLGKGDGTFTETDIQVPDGVSILGFVQADFNGDGIPDLALAVFDSGSFGIVVLQGVGDGTFTKKPLSIFPVQRAHAADLNGDGIPDLVALDTLTIYPPGQAPEEVIAVTTLLGNGDGTFVQQPSPTIINCGFPWSDVNGDFNGDGKPDLFLACGNTQYTLLGNGDGTFTVHTSPLSDRFSPLAVGDFNGDGIADLAGRSDNNGEGSIILTMLGNGDGTFRSATSTDIGASAVLTAAVSDFNEDGVSDLVIAGVGSTPTSTVLLGNGDGSFKLVSSFDFPGNFLASGGLAVSDLNGDGTPDMEFILDSNTTDNGVLSTELNEIGAAATANLTNVSVSGTEVHQVFADYPGDANYLSSSSGTVALLAAPVATTLTLSSSVNPTGYTAPVKLTATLAPFTLASYTTDGEVVTFYNGNAAIGTGVLSSGVTQFLISSLPPGANTLTAIYSGDGNFHEATSNSLIQQVNRAAQPLISPPSDTYTSAQSVTITDTTPGATIYYTTDGTNPSRSSAVFSGTPITVSTSQTVKALAVAPGNATSPEGVAIYNIIPPYAAAPTFTLPPGFYHTAQTVGLIDATPGARIYYTTDHSVPTTSSTLYTGGSIAINITTQLKAIAVAPGYSTSTIAVGDFYVSATQPIISPPTGRYSGAQTVTITSATPGATIFYTTDGSNPNWHSPVFNPASPITVTSSSIVKALAWAPGYTISPEGVAIYTITP